MPNSRLTFTLRLKVRHKMSDRKPKIHPRVDHFFHIDSGPQISWYADHKTTIGLISIDPSISFLKRDIRMPSYSMIRITAPKPQNFGPTSNIKNCSELFHGKFQVDGAGVSNTVRGGSNNYHIAARPVSQDCAGRPKSGK
jgi:hypothetical protein